MFRAALASGGFRDLYDSDIMMEDNSAYYRVTKFTPDIPDYKKKAENLVGVASGWMDISVSGRKGGKSTY